MSLILFVKWLEMLGMTLLLEIPRITFGGTIRVQCASSNLVSSTLNVSAASNNVGDEFPHFLPKEVHQVKDPLARTMAKKIQRLPVVFSGTCIMSSCLKPNVQKDANPVVLLHCFDSSCLEWRCTYPLLEEAGLETWAIDVLGWGFSDLKKLPPCNPVSKRDHLYQFWKSHIKRPMILVGPSLGAAVAIDFAINYPEAVDRLVIINASVYAGGASPLQKLPKIVAYIMAYLIKSIPFRLLAKSMAFDHKSLPTIEDWTNVSRLHCLLPWWEDATANYILSGGYDVTHQLQQVQQRVLILWGDHDKIIDINHAERLRKELSDATLKFIPGCGHFPHVEKPMSVAKLIVEFAQESRTVRRMNRKLHV